MFTFCEFLHEAKQKTEAKSQECAVRTGNHPYRACDILNSLKFLLFECDIY